MNIKELARRAGVSSATVSRVLNNSGYVKEETRKKVLEAVEEYNTWSEVLKIAGQAYSNTTIPKFVRL